MAQEDDEEDLVFNVEDVQKIVRDNIELCLGGNTYSHSRTPQWITIITEKTLARLNKLNKPFKYILYMDGNKQVPTKVTPVGALDYNRRLAHVLYVHGHSIHSNVHPNYDNAEKRFGPPYSGSLLLGHRH